MPLREDPASLGSVIDPFAACSPAVCREGPTQPIRVTPAADPWSDRYAWWMPPSTAETWTMPRHASSRAGMNNDAAAFGGVIWITADVWHACEPEGTSL